MTANSKIQIPESEIVFKASKSSGPGGQNVNKLNTKVMLVFDVQNSKALTPQQKTIIQRKLASRITNDNKLLISSQKFRTQNANKIAVKEKLELLIEKALKKPKKRKPTRPTLGSVEKRLKHKKIKSELKLQRKKVVPSE